MRIIKIITYVVFNIQNYKKIGDEKTCNMYLLIVHVYRFFSFRLLTIFDILKCIRNDAKYFPKNYNLERFS